MLDFNLASPGTCGVGGDERKGVDDSGNWSGTSDSSVLNLDSPGIGGDEDSTSTPTTPFRFSILNKGGDGACGEQRDGVGDEKAFSFSTRELFPASGFERSCWAPDGSRVVSFSALVPSSSVPRSHLVDLNFCQADVAARTNVKTLQLGHQQVKKSRRGPRSRSSQYRGVTFYRRTGRWESHIWDCGKQVYLGGFDTAHAAARAYDRAAIKFRGIDADINFNLSDYDEDLKQMRNLTKVEFVHILRRQSTGFSRGSSKYKGVTLDKCGRWEARTGQFLGNMNNDKAAIRCNGREIVTNFQPNTYKEEMTSQFDTDGAYRNLDLSLKISQPVAESPKGSINLTTIQFKPSQLEVMDAKNSMAEVASSFAIGQPYRVAVVPELSPAWSLPYKGFFSNQKERAYDKSPDMVRPALSDWTWQMQGAPSPLYTSAASSGFSATTLAVACPSQIPTIPYKQSQHPSSAFHSYSRRI